MKFAKFSFFICLPLLVFAGTNTLPEITETIRTKPVMENLRQALIGDIVPRDSAGVACSGCSDLGTDTYKWKGIFLDYENSGALRTYAYGLTMTNSAAVSQTVSSSSYSHRVTSVTISNPLTRPILINFNCKNASVSNFQIDKSNNVLWVRLGRLVGTTETYISTFTLSNFVEEVVGVQAQLDTFFPTSLMTYIDVNPPTTDYKYIFDFAASEFQSSNDVVSNFCYEVITL